MDYSKYPAPSTWVDYTGDEGIVEVENTIKVLESHDKTYFMTIGCSAGYMGIQDRGDEKQDIIIFSIWDQADYKATVMELGPGVEHEKFGGEGTGAKTTLEYNWERDVSYTFRLAAKPQKDGTVDYEAHFKDHDSGEEQLLARIRTKLPRDWHIKGLGSFIEDYTNDGDEDRDGSFRRECLYGPLFFRREREAMVPCSAAKGASNDGRCAKGYMNRHVYLASGGCIGACSGGDGKHTEGTKLFNGSLPKTKR